ncbi:MAG: hypothetical protein ABIO46_08710 [Chitinophagales bacterium]
MKKHFIYSSLYAILAIILLFLLFSCNKTDDTEVKSNLWKLNSVTINGVEQLFRLEEYESYNITTSCSTELTIHDSMALNSATLDLNEIFIYETMSTRKFIDFDSTYNSCQSFYGEENYFDRFGGSLKMDDTQISVTYQFGNSIGGWPLYNTQTFDVMELTKNTLKISGPYPMPYLYGYKVAVYSFSK